MAEAKEEQPQLLLDTLNRLWSHYLQASDCEPDDIQAASVKVCVKLVYRPLRKPSVYSYHLYLHFAGTLAVADAIQLSVLG